MPAGKFKGVSLPKELVDEISKTIEERKELGYASVAEFIKEAVREKLDQIKLRSSEFRKIVELYVSEFEISEEEITETIKNFDKVLAILARNLLRLEIEKEPQDYFLKEVRSDILSLEIASLVLKRYDVFFGLLGIKKTLMERFGIEFYKKPKIVYREEGEIR